MRCQARAIFPSSQRPVRPVVRVFDPDETPGPHEPLFLPVPGSWRTTTTSRNRAVAVDIRPGDLVSAAQEPSCPSTASHPSPTGEHAVSAVTRGRSQPGRGAQTGRGHSPQKVRKKSADRPYSASMCKRLQTVNLQLRLMICSIRAVPGQRRNGFLIRASAAVTRATRFCVGTLNALWE
jgi:hypothetical protein